MCFQEFREQGNGARCPRSSDGFSREPAASPISLKSAKKARVLSGAPGPEDARAQIQKLARTLYP